ncbi:MAG TPA: TonB-dependent receptor [Gemmatimonadales bacterium]|nr:TonB-dependent receptor [Gemmatimonadales bacterium]
MFTQILVRRLSGLLAALGLLGLAAAGAAAQTTTGTIRGTVTNPEGAAIAGAEVEARNPETGIRRATTTRADGTYTLPGLVPALYDVTVRFIGHAPQARKVRVLIGATQTEDFALEVSAVELQELVVAGARPPVEMRTSEVATNVTAEQINNLPTSSRNFLDLAVLAPGTTFTNDRLDGTARTFAAGAQLPDQTNLFIDGASYKNDLIHGGAVGQDRSRGNPFPRNAVQEFRILTQNYKAEYQKASSAILTATTKSGGNRWSGQAFLSYQDQGLVALDTFARARKKTDPNFREPDYQRYLVGLSAGGPIIKDKLHIFASYEGNYQDRDRRVFIDTSIANRFPALDTIDFASRNGLFLSPFRSTLFFGKLSYAAGPSSSLELSYNNRHETDTRDFGELADLKRPFESGVRFRNDVNTAILKFNHFRGDWLNEATFSFQRARDNPSPVPGPEPANRFFGGSLCCAQLGPDITIQDFTQKRFAIRNDLTYSGLRWGGEHVIKGGVSVDFLHYRILKQNGVIPRFVYEEFGPPTAGVDSFKIPDRVEFRIGNPNFLADNQQIGAYLQDDWTPHPRLTLNLGLRWDYETRMMNFDYVTPQPIVDSLTKYASRLFIPIDPDRYFTDGTQRPRWTGGFQPRVGFSLALDKEGRTTLFGGFGIFHDRTLFDIAIEEEFAQRNPNVVIRFRQPGDTTSGRVDWDPRYFGNRAALDSLRIANPQAGAPEVKLLPNDLRPPKSRQFSVGLRRLIKDVAIEAAYTGVRSSNVFTFYFANMNFTCPERSFAVPNCFVVNSIPGFGTILKGTNAGKTWYDALQVKVDRPYRRAGSGRWGWGAGLAYTYAERETQGFNDDFSFPNPVDYPRQVRNDERHRVVVNWVTDFAFLYGIQFSGLFTVGSGVKLDVGDRFDNEQDPVNSPRFRPGGFDTPTFKNLDLRLRKDFPSFRGTTVGATLDVFNVFNWQNLGCYNTFNPNDPNFGKAGCVISDPRRFQLGFEYNF